MSISITKKTTGAITLPKTIIRIAKEWKIDWDTISGMASGIPKDYAIYNSNLLQKISKSKTIDVFQIFDLYILAIKNIKDEQFCNNEGLDKLTAFFPNSSNMLSSNSAIESEAIKILKFINKDFEISH